MKVLIIEDELPAAKRLSQLLLTYPGEVEVLATLDSIESSVKFLSAENDARLIFMDIHLADGLSFEIFEKTEVNIPVIFTTAYDQYALKAFKVNSIDYLLKPIDEKELFRAVEKFHSIHSKKEEGISEKMLRMVQEISTSKFKERLLIKRGQQLSYLKTSDTAYCYADGKLCYAVGFNGTKYLLEPTLSQLEKQLQPADFFRINRHLLLNINSISKVHTWLGGRLKVELAVPAHGNDTVVSRDRVNDFKEWLGG
ncbi:LytTR family DNA-binding domain-containing protein [Ferruginibacter sp. HRS2-29]|uniref:LytR/AlgR family response regulator transcription factor n=1 Tax=Ferruginibacter sp. HRS2-29 TaxID=2487334 RepID=UPI0020CD22EF|nr:LytTR family DNA-binding domain-containing protein [Ferruginibacter sp. HRS2-29]MCP9751110.1 DNA-binding response regulator [Ferruginibacter sp. HRS2-29]